MTQWHCHLPFATALRFIISTFIKTYIVTALIMSLSSGHKVGVNFALKLQRNPLGNREAARILLAKFPLITKAKIFDHDVAVLEALRSEGIKHVIIAVPNFQVNALARDRAFSSQLVGNVIEPQISKGLSLTVAISNEPFAPWNNIGPDVLVNAYRNLRSSLAAKNLSGSVKITIPFYSGILEKTYPPSAGCFDKSKIAALRSLTALLYEDRSSFDINLYGFFAHRDQPKDVSLSYALGETGHTVDGVTYNGLLQAQVAAVRAALLRLDSRFTDSGLPIVVGETGWPTAGHGSASVENAAKYAKNAVASGISLYLFEAFDEKLKSRDSGAGAAGDVIEDNWGIFTESGLPKYGIAALQG